MFSILKLGVLFASIVVASPVERRASGVRYLFTFGDSYTSSSFDINGVQPSRANPMGNPVIGQGTTANGPNYVADLTTTYNTTLTYNFNFGQSGAIVSQHTTSNRIISFEDQVGTLFNPKYSTKPGAIAPWTSDNAIFSIFIGINDISLNYLNSDIDRNSFIAKTMHYYFNSVQDLYYVGARKFIFQTVPPLQRSPFNLQYGNYTKYAEWVSEYNRQLKLNTDTFMANYKDVQFANYDFNKFFTGVLDYPSAFGFQDATCIGDGSNKCIWANNFHPGYTLDKYWAKDMIPTLSAVGW